MVVRGFERLFLLTDLDLALRVDFCLFSPLGVTDRDSDDREESEDKGLYD